VLERTPRPAPAATAEPSRRRPDLLLTVLVLVVVTAVLTAGALALRARGEAQAEQARTAAVAAAETHAVDVLSYDHRHLGRDFKHARAVLTGDFERDYVRTTRRVVRPTAEQVEAVVKAEVVASSVVRAEANRAVVLLFVNQTTTSNRLDGPKIDRNRVKLTMTKVDGQWLVSQVAAL
jgi:Mce-associated membrane protein